MKHGYLVGLGMLLLMGEPFSRSIAPTLSVDLIPTTAGIDSTASQIADSSFWVAIKIANAQGLDAYGFELTYNRSLLLFDTAVAVLPASGLTPFLTSQGGLSIGLNGQLLRNDSAKIVVVNALSKRDSLQSPSGNGILALIRFRPKGNIGEALFSLNGIQLIDWKQNVDSNALKTGARLTLNSIVVSLHPLEKTRLTLASRIFKIQMHPFGISRDLRGRSFLSPPH